MRITWLGHAAYHIETANGKSILVDPFITDGPSNHAPGDFEPDVVLLTHGHADHTGDVLAYRTAHVVTNFELGLWLTKQGMTTVTGMNVGGFAKPVDGVKLYMTPATHSSGLEVEGFDNGTLGCGGSPGGFVLDDGDTKVYIAGDTGLFGDMRTVIRDVLEPDVAIVPIGDLFTMGPEHAAIAVEWLGVKVATPCHYDTFPPIEQDPERFKQLVGGRADVRVLDVDGSFEVRQGSVK